MLNDEDLKESQFPLAGDMHDLVEFQTDSLMCGEGSHQRFGPLLNYFVYLETDIWVERKKKFRCFRKKQTELNELRQTVLLNNYL